MNGISGMEWNYEYQKGTYIGICNLQEKGKYECRQQELLLGDESDVGVHSADYKQFVLA